jgi:outer membrane protein assembly factor BamD
MKNSLIFTFFIASLVLVSCSGYNRVVKSDNYDDKFKMANELFDKGEELRAVTLYEQVYQRIPKSGEGEVSYFRIGKAYFIHEDYVMAEYYMGQFSQRFPMSPKAEESMFLSAMCSVEKSPEYSLDQTETEIAINNLQQFIDRYPETELLDTCNIIIDKMRGKLTYKDYTIVKMYSKTEQFHAAVSSGLTFIRDYPKSEYLEEIHYILVKNSYLLSKNSIDSKKIERIEDTFERYRTFVELFPESKYRSSLAGYVDVLSKEKDQLTISNK